MTFVKFIKASTVYLAAFQFFRTEQDIHVFLKACAVALILQLFVCIKQRYIDHAYQVHAWFEHQNSLVMYSYMLGLPLLAAGLAHIKRNQTILYLSGFACAVIAAIFSLSRAGLVMFAAGILLLVVLTLWDRVTTRRLAIIATLAVLGTIPVGFAAKSIIQRFNDPITISSNESRQVMNATSRDMLHDFPLFGTGWNNYAALILPPHKYGNRMYDWERSRGHRITQDLLFERGICESWYYLMLAETGFVGTAACFAFILITLFWCARAIVRYRRTLVGAIAIGLFCGIGMNYLQSNYERVLLQEKNLVAWLICLGLIARMEWWRRQRRTQTSSHAQHYPV
jgi:O-antigen ligase/polysaccharide polymerase Wzy-like membrane protein